MDLTMIDPIWWIVLGVLVVLLLGLLVWSARRKANRTERLKDQFKSEYDRTASSSSRKQTEEDLERRTARRSRVDLADLEESDAASLEQQLDELLRSFVDGPQGAALGVTQLVERVANARGYVATEGSVLDLVSVDHPEQVAAVRRSEDEMQKAKGAELTEASRQTFLDARVLAQRLLAEGRARHLAADVSEPPPPTARPPQSDSSADVPSPPAANEEPRAPESNRSTGTNSTGGPATTDGPQSGPTASGSHRG
jgi:hypothetical protein